MPRYDVFISYRREGGAETARLLRMALSQHGYRAFLDVDDLSSGHFDERLLHYIAETPHFIVILSPGSLANARDPRDWLRLEVEQAMRTGRNLVPLLMPGFDFPARAGLPAELQQLERHNAVSYSHQYFDATVQRLLQYMPRDDAPLRERAPGASDPPADPLDADAYQAFVPIPATPYIVLGLLTAWVYVALGIGRALVEHMAGRRRYFSGYVQTAGLAADRTQHDAFAALAGPAFEIEGRWPKRFALGLAIAGLYTVCLFVFFLLARDPPLLTPLPVLLLALASCLFYGLVSAFVLWFRATLKRHDRYERLLFHWLSDPRVGPTTLAGRDFSSRWEVLDQHVALFVIVGLPVMFSPAIAGWYVLFEMAVPLGTLMVPLWVLVLAGAYHMWGVRLLRQLYHSHLAAEQA